MKRIVKVHNRPANKGYEPAIRIAGKWLNKYGFKLGDKVIITVDPGIIRIEKIQKNQD